MRWAFLAGSLLSASAACAQTLKALISVSGTDGSNPYADLIADANGNLFDTTEHIYGFQLVVRGWGRLCTELWGLQSKIIKSKIRSSRQISIANFGLANKLIRSHRLVQSFHEPRSHQHAWPATPST